MYTIISTFDWIKPCGSEQSKALSLIRVPTIQELELFIREYMVYNDRILYIWTYYYKNGSSKSHLSEDECDQFYKLIILLLPKFYPWQFKIMSQTDKTTEFEWVEVNDWLDKYLTGHEL